MMESLTATLVIITAFYAWVTYKILRANQGVLREMKEQQDSLYRPYISISPVLYPGNSIFHLKIQNTGQTAAHNLKLSLDQDFYRHGDKRDSRNLRNIEAFSRVIASFAPGAQMFFHLGPGFKIFGNKADETITPPVFTVMAEYEYLNKRVSESTVIDVKPYLSSVIPPDPVVSRLKDIKEAIEKMSRK